MSDNLPPITALIPHRGTMLLLERLLSADAHHACAHTDAACQSWYASTPGTMPAWIGIELMAQTVAAHVGWTKSQQGLPPKQGVLLGTRNFQTALPVFTGPLEIVAQLSFMDESGLGAYDCSIRTADRDLASATIKVFEPADFHHFLNSHTPTL